MKRKSRETKHQSEWIWAFGPMAIILYKQESSNFWISCKENASLKQQQELTNKKLFFFVLVFTQKKYLHSTPFLFSLRLNFNSIKFNHLGALIRIRFHEIVTSFPERMLTFFTLLPQSLRVLLVRIYLLVHHFDTTQKVGFNSYFKKNEFWYFSNIL